MESPPSGATPPQPPPGPPPQQPPPPPGPPPEQPAAAPPQYGAPPPPPQYGAPPPYPPPAPPGWAPPATVQAGPAPGLAYAGFWIRALAIIVDGIGLGIIRLLGDAVFVRTEGGVVTSGGWWLAIWYILVLAYYVVTWVQLGETLGHRLFNMEVLREEDGQRIDYGRAIVRVVGYIISWIPIGLGLVWAAFDPRKQGWHDKLAHTVVVRRLT